MKKRYFNKRLRKRKKANLKRSDAERKKFSKRIGGIVGVSVLVENRDTNANDLSKA